VNIQVPGIGPLDASIAIVGEAPGADEVYHRRPFVGPTGQELDRILRGVGIVREECYITNVIKERVSKDKTGAITGFIKLKRSDADTTSAYKEYEELLYQELRECRANVIVPMGGIALWALARKVGVTRWRGSILPSVSLSPSPKRIGEGLSSSDYVRKVVPTIHPATTLKYGAAVSSETGRGFSPYLYRYYIAHDLKKALSESGFPEIQYRDRTYHIAPTVDEVNRYLDLCMNADRIGVDIETSYGQIECISLSLNPTSSMSIPFFWDGQEYFDLDTETEVWRRIANILENPNIVKIIQNAMFDCTVLRSRYGIKVRNIDDTMIAHAVAFPDLHRSLEFMTSVYTDVPYYKDEGKIYFKGGYSSPRDFAIYNAKDSIVLHEIMDSINHDLERTANTAAYRQQAKLIEPLMYMEERGMKVDVERLEVEKKRMQEILQTSSDKFKSQCGYDINPDSPSQVMEYFYERKKLKPYVKKTSDGTWVPTVDIKALKRLSARGYKEAHTLLKFRKAAKLIRTYFEVTLDDDGRLRSRFNPARTVSGRLSSSTTLEGTGTNIQNLPQDMRQFIIPDDGYLLFSADLSLAEKRVVAYVAPEPRMIKAFEEGIDLHSQTAALILGKHIDEISNESRSCSIGNGEESERFYGKKANFGLDYGIGPARFALELEISQKEARTLMDMYFAAYPGILHYHTWVERKLSEDMTLTNCMGRKRLFMGRWDKSLLDSAYDWIPQSTVAGIINEYGLGAMYYDQDTFGPVELLNQIHDSIVFQIPISIGWEEMARVIWDVKKSLEVTLKWEDREFVIPADFEVGLNFRKGSEENPKGMYKIKVNEYLPKILEERYAKLQSKAV